MAWRNQELTAEDLKKAGLDPADLAEMKANGVKKADLDTMKSELATSMTELITNQFKEMEGRLRPQATTTTTTTTDNDGMTAQEREQMEWVSDPVGFINKRTNQSIAVSMIQSTKTRMDLALDRAKMNLKGFKNSKLSEEIMQEWSTYTPEQCAMWRDKDGKPNFDPDAMLKKVHDMVIGRHADEINHDTNKREGVYNLVASGNSGGGNGGGNVITDNAGKKPEDMMTDLDRKQAARYGMTAEQWIQADKDMADEEKKIMSGVGA